MNILNLNSNLNQPQINLKSTSNEKENNMNENELIFTSNPLQMNWIKFKNVVFGEYAVNYTMLSEFRSASIELRLAQLKLKLEQYKSWCDLRHMRAEIELIVLKTELKRRSNEQELSLDGIPMNSYNLEDCED